MSKVPTSCSESESTVLPAPVEAVWNKFRDFRLEKVSPGQVKTTEYISGSPGTVGSVVKISYQNGGVWECLITEVSDRNFTIAYRVINASPEITASSVEGELVFERISDGDQTFLKWTTEFTNDADANVIADQKYKKLDFFAEFKKAVVA